MRENIFEKLTIAIKKIDAESIGKSLVEYGRQFVDFISKIDTESISKFVSNLVEAAGTI